MNNYKLTFLLSCTLLASGCGTLRTNVQNDVAIKRDLRLYKTNCEHVNRIYSGVAYDACKLNSKASDFDDQFFLGFYVADLPLSGIFDTILLPYTVYKQNVTGPVKIE